MKWVLLVLLSGCETLFPLDPGNAPPPDAPGPSSCPLRQADVDEDGDTIFDADDNCPGTRNQDQADVDGDGVGDSCDPYPEIRNTLCFFGFNNAAELDLLDPLTLNWEIAGGLLTVTMKSGRDAVILPSEWISPEVTTHANGLSASTNDFDKPRFGVIVAGSDLREPIPIGVSCDIENHFPPVVPTVRILILPSLFNVVENLQAPNDQMGITFSPASPNAAGKPLCVGDHGGPGVGVELPNVGSQAGQVAVFVENGTAAIDFIQLVDVVQ